MRNVQQKSVKHFRYVQNGRSEILNICHNHVYGNDLQNMSLLYPPEHWLNLSWLPHGIGAYVVCNDKWTWHAINRRKILNWAELELNSALSMVYYACNKWIWIISSTTFGMSGTLDGIDAFNTWGCCEALELAMNLSQLCDLIVLWSSGDAKLQSNVGTGVCRISFSIPLRRMWSVWLWQRYI